MQMSIDVRRFGVGAGLIGGAVAVALTLGLGGAHAGAADQIAGVAAAGSADSTDLLIIASANFLDAKDVITGIDTSDLSDALLSAVESMQRLPDILDRFVSIDDELAPAESAILAHSGSMSSLIDQLFFAPLNQRWADASESMLYFTNAFDNAIVEFGSVGEAARFSLQILGLTCFDVIPVVFASMPVVWIGSLFDDTATTSDFFDFLL